MSIAARLRKAESDLAMGDFENALIQSLIAIAAMSKLRYPNAQDGKAFKAFLKDEFLKNIQPNISIIGGYLKVQISDEVLTIEDILYRHVRCHLLHEAQLSPQLCFIGPATGFSISYENGKLQLGRGVVEVFMRIVREALEYEGNQLQC
jgi:hypothetical protein